ncbi:protein-tyrosine phosphatase-like protein, partial [Diplogelasinospora grovesii]
PLIKEVEPGSGLYLADPRFANNPALLRSNGITAVVSLTASPNALLWNSDEYRSVIPRNRHLWIPSLDSNTQDLLQHFHRISEFITRQLRPWWKDPWEKEQASAIGFGPDDDLEFIPNLLTDDHHRKGPGRPAGEKLRSLTPRPTRRVLVHCLDNLSRSKAVLAAHVMCKRGWGLRKTMNKLPAVRPANQAFMEQLRIWEELECDIFEDDEKVKGGKVFKARYREF